MPRYRMANRPLTSSALRYRKRTSMLISMTRSPSAGPRLRGHSYSSKTIISVLIGSRFLQEIGYEDIFNSEEVSEIRALYEKAQEEMKENLGMNQSQLQQQVEERMLADEHFQRHM